MANNGKDASSPQGDVPNPLEAQLQLMQNSLNEALLKIADQEKHKGELESKLASLMENTSKKDYREPSFNTKPFKGDKKERT